MIIGVERGEDKEIIEEEKRIEDHEKGLRGEEDEKGI